MNGGWHIPKHMVPQPEELTGETISFLTVLRRAGTYGIYNGWICRCTCGKETTKQTTYLQSARAKGGTMACESCIGERRRERKRQIEQDRLKADQKCRKVKLVVTNPGESPRPKKTTSMCKKCCDLPHARPEYGVCPGCGWTRGGKVRVVL